MIEYFITFTIFAKTIKSIYMYKHYFSLIVFFNLLFAVSINSQTTFYYYKGEKIIINKTINTTSPYKTQQNDITYTNDEGLQLIPTNSIYIKLKKLQDYNLLVEVAKTYNLQIISQNKFQPLWYTLKTPKGFNPISISNDILESGKFEASSPDFYCNGFELSYDPFVHQQWGLYNNLGNDIDISISEAWNYATGKGIKIAIIDDGIDCKHEDLIENIYEKSYDANTDNTPSSLYGEHGSHCAGIAAAVRNNGKGITGVAPNAKLISVSFSFENNDKINESIANGINWAWKNGADIISCSWTCQKNELVASALDSAAVKGRQGKGCIIIKSAGNTGRGITWPGYYRDDIIVVGNIKKKGKRFAASSHGGSMFVMAPGMHILSTTPNNTYATKIGTSMSAPHVAGVVALLLEINPNLTNEQIQRYIGMSAKKVGDVDYITETIKPYGPWNEYYGYGLLNAIGAVKMALTDK